MRVDLKRLFLSRVFYIMLVICLASPILILVMTTMMDGSVSVNAQTGEETVIEGFDNVWQIIGSVSDKSTASEGEGAEAMEMNITSMCNINMLYFGIIALISVFVSEDFRSGYSKNLFTVRAKKSDYVASKTVILCFGSAIMIFAFFIGSLIGGALTGQPFDMIGFNGLNLLMCILSKTALVGVFVPIYLVMSTVAKEKVWMSAILSMTVGMFLFMMIPMLTPLDATLWHLLLILIGGVGMSVGIGRVSTRVLEKISLV